MWPALSFVLHTLFFSFTRLQDIYYSPSFPREEMTCEEVKSLAPGRGAGWSSGRTYPQTLPGSPP